MANNKRVGADVEYYVPDKKKPIARGTKATKDLIDILAKESTTINELYSKIIYDQEAKEIIKKYIDLGYGDDRP